MNIEIYLPHNRTVIDCVWMICELAYREKKPVGKERPSRAAVRGGEAVPWESALARMIHDGSAASMEKENGVYHGNF